MCYLLNSLQMDNHRCFSKGLHRLLYFLVGGVGGNLQQPDKAGLPWRGGALEGRGRDVSHANTPVHLHTLPLGSTLRLVRLSGTSGLFCRISEREMYLPHWTSLNSNKIKCQVTSRYVPLITCILPILFAIANHKKVALSQDVYRPCI